MSQSGVLLNDGRRMPRPGLGVHLTPPEETPRPVGRALFSGYRSVDRAAVGRNERGVGHAARASEVADGGVFDVEPAADDMARICGLLRPVGRIGPDPGTADF